MSMSMSMSMSIGYICPSTEGQPPGSGSNHNHLSGDQNSSNNNGSSSAAPRLRVINPIGTIGWQAPELMTHLRSHAPPPTAEAPEAALSDEQDDDDDEEVDDEEEEVDDEEYGDDEEQEGEGSCRDGAVESGRSGSGLTSAKLTSRRAHKNKSRDSVSDDVTTLAAPTDSEVGGDSISLKSTATQGACKITLALSSPFLSKKKTKPLLLQQQQSVRKRTQKCDIFSAGLVYFYVLVPGEHPFGQWFEREANIMTGKSDLTKLDDMPEAADLVRRMLASDPDVRPTAAQVCRHPFFWSAQRRLEFLVDLSDRLEHESVTAAPVLALEASASIVVGRGGWDRNLDPGLLLDMNKYRKYDSHCVRDLLRVVRNKRWATLACSCSSSLPSTLLSVSYHRNLGHHK